MKSGIVSGLIALCAIAFLVSSAPASGAPRRAGHSVGGHGGRGVTVVHSQGHQKAIAHPTGCKGGNAYRSCGCGEANPLLDEGICQRDGIYNKDADLTDRWFYKESFSLLDAGQRFAERKRFLARLSQSPMTDVEADERELRGESLSRDQWLSWLTTECHDVEAISAEKAALCHAASQKVQVDSLHHAQGGVQEEALRSFSRRWFESLRRRGASAKPSVDAKLVAFAKEVVSDRDLAFFLIDGVKTDSSNFRDPSDLCSRKVAPAIAKDLRALHPRDPEEVLSAGREHPRLAALLAVHFRCEAKKGLQVGTEKTRYVGVRGFVLGGYAKRSGQIERVNVGVSFGGGKTISWSPTHVAAIDAHGDDRIVKFVTRSETKSEDSCQDTNKVKAIRRDGTLEYAQHCVEIRRWTEQVEPRPWRVSKNDATHVHENKGKSTFLVTADSDREASYLPGKRPKIEPYPARLLHEWNLRGEMVTFGGLTFGD